MDVEALYFTIDKVCEQLHDSAAKFADINYKELGLCLSLVKTDEELRDMGLHDVCTKRSHRRGPCPKITGCGAQESEENRHAQVSRINETTKRKLLVEAIRVVLKVLMETHTYEFVDIIRRQTKGGVIGMELTGFVAQIWFGGTNGGGSAIRGRKNTNNRGIKIRRRRNVRGRKDNAVDSDSHSPIYPDD